MKLIKTIKLLWKFRKIFKKAAADNLISIREIIKAVERVCKDLDINMDSTGIEVKSRNETGKEKSISIKKLDDWR